MIGEKKWVQVLYTVIVTSFPLDRIKLAYSEEKGYSFFTHASILQKWSVDGAGGRVAVVNKRETVIRNEECRM